MNSSSQAPKTTSVFGTRATDECSLRQCRCGRERRGFLPDGMYVLLPSTTIPSTSTTAAIFRLCMEASASMLAAATRSMPWNSPRTVLLLPWRLDAQATAAPTAKSRHQRADRQRAYAVNPNGEDRFYDIAYSPDGRYWPWRTAISTSSTPPHKPPHGRSRIRPLR